MNLLFKAMNYSLLVLLVLAGGLVYALGNGIPFIEGDTIVSEGDGYGFRIGMSKEETFETLSANYNKNDYFVRTISSDTRLPIGAVDVMPVSFQQSEHWDILMPTSWVNSIYLTFDNDQLKEIKRSQWLFERP